MIDFLKTFKTLVKVETVHTDNNVFKLHYKITVILLIVFSILLSSKQYFGDPISCDVEMKDKVELLNLYCWITGTFIVNKNLEDVYLPGLGNDPTNDIKAVTRQLYYQWVCLVFIVQAFFFYLPRFLWKSWEGGRLRLLTEGLCGAMVTEQWTDKAKDKLIQYVMSGKYSHNIYAIRYTVCEVLNLLNLIAQLIFMEWFLTGNFTMYGISFLSDKNMQDSMNKVFPKITKCIYRNYGPSGSTQTKDALCILPLNILNEKFFLILWFWMFILMFLTVFALIYRVLFIFSKKFRMYLLRAQARDLEKNKADNIISELTYGGFFLLYKIGKNINPVIYKELILNVHDYITSNGVYKRYPHNLGDVCLTLEK